MTNQHGRDRDLLPPARIPDLLVVRTIREDKVVVLTWTASGDDLDKSRGDKWITNLWCDGRENYDNSIPSKM